jgi:hypothetical protein
MKGDLLAAFAVRPIGSSGHEILNSEGVVIARAVDQDWA